MTQLSAHDVAGYWVGAGGPKRRAVEWVAIALGESGYDTAALSSAGAIGLWQIMPFNAAPHGYSVSQLYDPHVNARIAVEMSGGGTNCAAWDSCYRNILVSGRYSFLGFPEVGSADYNNLVIVARQLGGEAIDPIAGSAPLGMGMSIAPAMHAISKIQHVMLPREARQLLQLRNQNNRQFLNGWRP